MTVVLQAEHTSYAGVAALVHELGEHLADEGILRVRAEGGEYKFIRFEKSPIPGLFRGQSDAFQQIVEQFWDAEGQPVTIRRKNYVARREIQGAAVTLAGGPTSRHFFVDNPGNLRSPARVVVTPPPTAKALEIRGGAKSKGNLSELAIRYGFEVENAILYGGATGDTSVVADATASGGNKARTSFTNVPTMARRWRVIIRPSDRTAIQGFFRLFVVGWADPGALYFVQGRFGEADVDPVEIPGQLVPLNTAQIVAGNGQWSPIDLGLVEVHETDSVLVLEGWASRHLDYAAGNLDWDHGFLVPADESFFTVSVPGFRTGEPGKERWLGKELTVPTSGGTFTAGTVAPSGDRIILDAQNEAAAPRPVGTTAAPSGLPLVVGRHTMRFLVTAQNNQATVLKIGEVRIRDVTAGVDVAKKDVKSKAQQTTTMVVAIQFEAVAGHLYQPQAIYTKATDARHKIALFEINDSVIRTVAGQQMIADAISDPREAVVRNVDGDRVSQLHAEGFLTLAPGPNLIVGMGGEVSNPGWEDVTTEPLSRWVKGLGYSWRVDVEPHDLTL